MLRFVLFDTMLFSPESNQEKARADLLWMLEALVQRDMAYLADHPNTPLLYKSGVVYERPAQFNGDAPEVACLKDALGPKQYDTRVSAVLDIVQQVLGGERFRDIGRILEKGAVDCDNLASWRVAELRQNGIQASPLITWKRRLDGGYTYHVLVRWPTKDPELEREDPSLLLGMGGESRKVDRDREIAKNQKRVQMALASGQKGKTLDVFRGPGDAASANGGDPFSSLGHSAGGKR